MSSQRRTQWRNTTKKTTHFFDIIKKIFVLLLLLQNTQHTHCRYIFFHTSTDYVVVDILCNGKLVVTYIFVFFLLVYLVCPDEGSCYVFGGRLPPFSSTTHLSMRFLLFFCCFCFYSQLSTQPQICLAWQSAADCWPCIHFIINR